MWEYALLYLLGLATLPMIWVLGTVIEGFVRAYRRPATDSRGFFRAWWESTRFWWRGVNQEFDLNFTCSRPKLNRM